MNLQKVCQGPQQWQWKGSGIWECFHLSGWTVPHNKVVSVCNALQQGKGHTFAFDFLIHLALTFKKGTANIFAVYNIVQAQHIEIYLGWWKKTISKKHRTEQKQLTSVWNICYSTVSTVKFTSSWFIFCPSCLSSAATLSPSGTLQAYANGGIELWGDCSNYAPAFPVLAWWDSNHMVKTFVSQSRQWNGDNMEMNKSDTKKSRNISKQKIQTNGYNSSSKTRCPFHFQCTWGCLISP